MSALPFSHPAFAPYAALIDALGLVRGLPSLTTLDAAAQARGVTNARGLPLRFVAPEGRPAARDYERGILDTGRVPTRAETWHDALNALVWLRFPHLKAALNAGHVAAMADETGPERSRRRDALTVFDESGVIVECTQPAWCERLATRAWEALFVSGREALAQEVRFTVIGHALLEKALAPYPGITGKCLCLPLGEATETAVVAALGTVRTPRELCPLPIQGVPGWDPANADPAYYANREVFRPLPTA